MNGAVARYMVLHIVPSVAGALLCLAVGYVLVRKPSRLLFHFLCFYLISIAHLALAFLTPRILYDAGLGGIGRVWEIGLAAGRLRYLFLVFFTHSVLRFRATTVLSWILSGLIGLGIALPFFIYSIIPNLVEIIVVLYVFFYQLTAYTLREKLGLPPDRRALLRAVLACSGFFLTGILLDLLEEIPELSVSFSLLLVDFQPVYLVCIGAVMTAWAFRELHRVPAVERPAPVGTADPSGPPLTNREREIVGLILRGETNASIAESLFISESTVKKHINNIFRKLDVTSRWELLKLSERVHPKE